MTMTGVWDGMFPAGEYHLKVQNENGIPISGAILNAFEDGTENLAFEYPLDNYSTEGDLISDEQGAIVVLHKPRGFEFGGSCWNLFWVYPICSDSPKFDFQISADGYKTIKFTTDELFAPAYDDRSNGKTTVTLENGENLQISVYELTFILKR